MSSETEGRAGQGEAADAVDTDDAPSDAALLDAVRDGDTGAFDVVYRRHVDAAQRLARVLTKNHSEADDLVSESFARLLTTLKSGGGPDAAVRAYVFTTMRRVHIDRGRSGDKVEPVEDVADYERAEAPDDPAVRKLDQAYAARAFAGLPERWQAVLWHTEVEGESAAQIAPLLGLQPNAVSAIAYRARERLRQLYLQQHLAAVEGKECRWCTERLGAYVRDKLGARESGRVREHLDECDACRIIYLDLVEVNAGFRFLLAPIILGSAAVPYLTAAGKAVGIFGFLPAFWGWWRKASRNPATAVAATVVLVMVLGVTAWATVGQDLFDGGRPTAQSTGGGGGGGSGGGGGGGGATNIPPAPTEKSSDRPSTTQAAQTSEPASTPDETTSAPPPTSQPATSEPAEDEPAESNPDPPAPSDSEPTEETSEPEPEETPSDEPTSDEPTEEPSDEPSEPTEEPETNEPFCLPVPVLTICAGGQGPSDGPPPGLDGNEGNPPGVPDGTPPGVPEEGNGSLLPGVGGLLP